jgi:hypothetical protein
MQLLNVSCAVALAVHDYACAACRLQLQHAFSQRSSGSSSGSDGSLTWDVPPVLERTFGPTAEAVADGLVAQAAPAAGGDAAPASADGQAATTISGSSSGSGISRPLSPSSQPLSSTTGLHPVVLLNRQEFARAADEHLQQLLWQLLQAEDVQQPDMWLPIVLRLVCEASRALLPAAAAAFGEQDPRFYVKVSGRLAKHQQTQFLQAVQYGLGCWRGSNCCVA